MTGSLRAATDLTGCSHHTAARLVAERDAGVVPANGPLPSRRAVEQVKKQYRFGKSWIHRLG